MVARVSSVEGQAQTASRLNGSEYVLGAVRKRSDDLTGDTEVVWREINASSPRLSSSRADTDTVRSLLI